MEIEEAIANCKLKSAGCIINAREHEQIAEWLEELRHLRNVVEYLRDSNLTVSVLTEDQQGYHCVNVVTWAEQELEAKP